MLIIPLLWISCHKAETRLESYHADLAVGFEHLPDSTKPWVYWYWISDHISKDGISRDLELMDSLGIGTALIGNVYLGNIVRGKIPVLSDNWYEHLQFAISEGARLGVDIGVFNGPGWVQSGGPWIDSTKCMHYLICKDTMVDTGFQLNRSSLGSMQGQPVALFAYPGKSILDQPVPNSVQGSFLDKSVKNLFDGRTDTKYAFPKGEMENRDLVIDFSYSNSISARSIKLIPGAEPFYVAFDLEVWKGNKFVNVCSGSIDRSNQMLTVGPRMFAPVIKAFAEVSGKKWRIRFRDLNKNKVWFTDVKRNGSLKEVILSGDEKLEGYVEKQLGKMHQLPGPDWKAYQWSEQVDYVDSTSHVNPETFLDLSGLLNDDAKTWTAPPGNWHIYQLSMVPTGVTNAPVAPEAQGFDVDKMQRRYVFDHFDHYIDPLLNRLSTQEKPALKYLVIDSYETGSQNWTDGLQGRFLEIYGYDPLPWLPVINGDIVGSPDLSDRFLWDLRRLIADEI
ncbi:MAG: hypothetical protein KDC53_23660, partial [Saprospiraceae bacterium]|nr:hypothetical protein [Saprospiraceae bacterium]